MNQSSNFQSIKDLLNERQTKKPPAYPWQELALRVIEELNIPQYKKNAVFRVCKQHPQSFIEHCLNDTKELAEQEKWKYFFKLVENIECK